MANENDLSAEELQGIWADMLVDRDYDSFEYNQHDLLKNKIGFALYGSPQEESGYNRNAKAHIDKLYDVIKTESNKIAEFKDKIEISFIFNCLKPLPQEMRERAAKFHDYNPRTDVNPVSVFILRKCRQNDKLCRRCLGATSRYQRNNRKCVHKHEPCRIFIDDTGRVYQNWQDYLSANKYPKCNMIVPQNGRYKIENERVLLEYRDSPACDLDAKLLLVGDIASTALGTGAVVVTAVAALPFLTIAAPILLGAGLTGAAAGMWGIGRSSYRLWDRNNHKETMSFANSEARGAYLNIVAGSLGFAGAGANIAITMLAAKGFKIGLGATHLVNTVGVLNISAGGTSLANSGFEVFDQWYNHNKTPSALTIIQLSTSVLFFGHAVYNFKSAQTIIDETVLQVYQDSLLFNRFRKTFNKVVDVFRTHGVGEKGITEVIATIRNIPNEDQVFTALVRNANVKCPTGSRLTAENRQIKLNGIPIDIKEFLDLNETRTETFLNNLSAKTSNNQSMTSITSSKGLKAAIHDILSDLGIVIPEEGFSQLLTGVSQMLHFCQLDIKTMLLKALHQAIQEVVNLCRVNCISDIIDEYIPMSSTFLKILQLGISFFSREVEQLEKNYQKYKETKDPRYYNKIFDYVSPLYVKRTVTIFKFVVENGYSGEMLTMAILGKLAQYVITWIARLIYNYREEKETENNRYLHSAGFEVKRTDCPVCEGYNFRHDT